MKINKRIGIIGKGFVGSAVQFGFSSSVGVDAEIKVYDKDQSKSTHTLQEVVIEQLRHLKKIQIVLHFLQNPFL